MCNYTSADLDVVGGGYGNSGAQVRWNLFVDFRVGPVLRRISEGDQSFFTSNEGFEAPRVQRLSKVAELD